MVKVHLGERIVLTKARDLSMAGLFLHGHPADSVKQITLTIPLPQLADITTTCTIVRREALGVALEFDNLDWDHMLLLARYLHPRLPRAGPSLTPPGAAAPPAPSAPRP